MTLLKICEDIKFLIKEILTAHQKSKEIVDNSHDKAHEALALLVELIKTEKIALIHLAYSRNNWTNQSYQGKKIVWNEEHGLGLKNSGGISSVDPLVVADGYFDIENLIRSVHSQLQSTLRTITTQNTNRKNKINQRNQELEQVIECLKNID